MSTINLSNLVHTAGLLRPLLPELAFVGGTITGLLVTEDAVGEARLTLDVDAIAEIVSYAEYAEFGERLKALGFSEDTTEKAPLCRWVHHTSILDIMPLDEKILGFSNPWYRPALESAVALQLSPDLKIRVVTAPYFLATKLEAFKGRGQGDFLNSRDLEDITFVLDGRPSLVAEVRSERPELREYLAKEFKNLLETQRFLDSLPGYLFPDAASQERITIVLDRMHELTRT